MKQTETKGDPGFSPELTTQGPEIASPWPKNGLNFTGQNWKVMTLGMNEVYQLMIISISKSIAVTLAVFTI